MSCMAALAILGQTSDVGQSSSICRSFLLAQNLAGLYPAVPTLLGQRVPRSASPDEMKHLRVVGPEDVKPQWPPVRRDSLQLYLAVFSQGSSSLPWILGKHQVYRSWR
ncbi:hypothetical protein DSO57_1022108 [Entomophthora muscae]|uniref:Uncharacterized protein n=1 Tax=Entomophthora muscae TaxID=34485 RepID=A0ACC2U196_9FUNG|nr:hypothetical protein DSO57_1022108 [Entomophthora muscae]